MNIISARYQVGRVRAELSFRLHGRHLAVVLLKYTILVSLPNRRSEFAMTSSASATARTPRSLVSHLFGMLLRCRAVVPLQATISPFQTNPNPGIHISRCGQQNEAFPQEPAARTAAAIAIAAAETTATMAPSTTRPSPWSHSRSGLQNTEK